MATIQDIADAAGLFAESQRLAMESIAVYRNLGIAVPASMKIVGYGNPYLLPYSSPKLSLIRENTAEIARQAVEVLVHMIERPEEPVPPVTVIPVSFEQNQTT
jgi:LacI family transcriptional regulator